MDQELMRLLSIQVRNCGYPEDMHQFLTLMLSSNLKIPNLKRSLQNMLIMHKGTDAALSVRVRI
jgi:hypothetical protein